MKRYTAICLMSLMFYVFCPLTSYAKLINSVGVSGGVSLPQGDWDPGFTVGAQANFGEAVKYIFISPYLNYSNAQQLIEVDQNTEDLSIQYLSLGAKLVGFINSKPRGFYLGGSISYNIISEYTLENGQLADSYTIQKNNTTKVGYAALMGYLFALKSFSIFVEADYMIVPGGYNNLLGSVGVDFNL